MNGSPAESRQVTTGMNFGRCHQLLLSRCFQGQSNYWTAYVASVPSTTALRLRRTLRRVLPQRRARVYRAVWDRHRNVRTFAEKLLENLTRNGKAEKYGKDRVLSRGICHSTNRRNIVRNDENG